MVDQLAGVDIHHAEAGRVPGGGQVLHPGAVGQCADVSAADTCFGGDQAMVGDLDGQVESALGRLVGCSPVGGGAGDGQTERNGCGEHTGGDAPHEQGWRRRSHDPYLQRYLGQRTGSAQRVGSAQLTGRAGHARNTQRADRTGQMGSARHRWGSPTAPSAPRLLQPVAHAT